MIKIITVGTINAHSLDVLHLATELTEYIGVRSRPGEVQEDDEDDSDELSKFFPTLVWAVRDHVSSENVVQLPQF